MIFTRQFHLFAAVSAAIVLAAPARSQERWPSPEEAARAFKAICLDNPGDHAAQMRAATAAPWNLKKSKDSEDRKIYLDGDPWQVALTTTESGLKMCSVTTGAAPDTTDAQVRTAAIRVLGPRPADLENDERGFSWIHRSDGKDYLVIYQSKTFENSGRPLTVASYALSW